MKSLEQMRRRETDVPRGDRPQAGPSRLPLLSLITLLVGLALTFIALRSTSPFANDRLPPGSYEQAAGGLVVAPIAGGPAGLQDGDAVTAIDGRSLSEWLTVDVVPQRRRGERVIYTVSRQGASVDVPIVLGAYPLGAILQREWGTVSFYALFLLIAAFVFLRRARLPAAGALFLGAAAQFGALPWSLGLHASDFVYPSRFWLYHVATVGSFMLAWIAYCHFALLFPQPLPLLRRRRLLLPLLYGLPYLALAFYLLRTRSQTPDAVSWIERWGWFTGLHAAVFSFLTLALLGWQFRNSRGATRQQIRWLVLAALLVAGAAIFFYFLPPLLGSPALDANLIGFVGVLFPVAIAISILRHQLFDIDTLLNRALVYGLLTSLVAALYILIVSLLGILLQAQDNLFVALLATGIAAALFQPLRDRLQRGVNRLMYGERDEPFEVLARMGERLEATLTPEMVYPTIVETVSQTLKLPYAAIAVLRQGRLQTVEAYGKPTADVVAFPLTYQGEPVGRLLVARRAPGEPFGDNDARILRNIALQAGAAVHAVQLLADLQQSRQQLVTAREEERRRLRRDLHDGLGPQLASQTLTIDAIDKMLTRDPKRARALLKDLKAQSRDAISDIRRLVDNLRPPALDELGLIAALREIAARHQTHGLAVTVVAGPMPPLPAAVEVAVFRVVQEALTNVVRHAEATACTVRLVVTAAGLLLTIEDNGRGLPAELQSGVGFQSMRERAAELGGSWQAAATPGGGVQVRASFPLSSRDMAAETDGLV